jgi:RimJ/RimL family protein N-acetyltransferase
MVREIYDTGEFFSEAFASLGMNLAKNSLLLGYASKYQFDRTNCHFQGIYGEATPDSGNIYSLISEHSGYNNYICSGSQDFDALMSLLDVCLERNALPSSAVADAETAKLLRVCFEQRAFQTRPIMSQKIYRCDRPVAPSNLEGLHLMRATEEHAKALTRWTASFIEEAIPSKRPQGDLEQRTIKKISKGSLYLLHNEEVFLGMANWTRAIPGAVGLNLIYVPPKERGKGYGKAVTYLLTKKLLEEDGYGETNLFADMSNAEVNQMYQKIGYSEVGQSEHFEVISTY